MIVAGIGCRRGASAADIEAVIAAALARAGLPASALCAIATSATKAGEGGIAAAAAARGVPLRLVEQHDLVEAAAQVVTRSARVQELTGVPSVAEAAALAAALAAVHGAGAGAGAVGVPEAAQARGTANTSGRVARLVLARVAVGPATCALAEAGGAP